MPEMKSLTLNGKQYDSFVDTVARPLSSATAIVRSASGESIVLPDSSDYKMLRLSVFGKSTQDGVPSPEAPVDIVNVANPTVTINKVPLSVPHNLPGIPVASGGNYTDANGQQWVCDEIDLARGVRVQRIGFTDLTDAGWTKNDSGKYFAYKSRGMYSDTYRVLCTHIYGGVTSDGNKDDVIYINSNHDIRLNIALVNDTPEAVTNAMSGAVLIGVLATPIETPLSAEEIATYGALYTTRPSTTLSVNKGAYMSVEYVADTKAYIDSLVGSAGIHNATVE